MNESFSVIFKDSLMTLMTIDLNDHEQAHMTGTRLSAECKIPKRRTILDRILITED